MRKVDYASLVKQIRVNRGLTQEDLAHELDVTVGTLNGWENGRQRPVKAQRKRLEALALKVGIDLAAFSRATMVNDANAAEDERDGN